jgi:hypothetical protein
MSIVTLFSTKAPIVGGMEFDAVLEDTLEAEVQITSYPIESGARAADHRIILPYRWSIVGIMSNNPFAGFAGSLVGGALSNFASSSGVAATVAGISAGLLAGSKDTRASDSLQALITMMVANQSFTVKAGDIELKNMVITKISRTKNPTNENGLEFEAQLQELPVLSTVTAGRLAANPPQSQLNQNDPSASAASSVVDKGAKTLQSATANETQQVNNVISAL